MNLIGGYTYSKNTYSYAAAEVIIPHVLGNFYNFLFDTTTWESISENTSLLLAFGGVPLKNGQINQGGVGSHNQRDYLKNASSNGVKFINVSPLKSDLETVNEVEWISIKPNTDVALMLALCYEIYKSGATDRKFINKYTVGFKKFTKYLNGDTDGVIKNAEWASQITGLSSDAIFDLIKEIKSMFGEKYNIVIAPAPNEIEKAKNLSANIILNNGKALDIIELISFIKEASYVVSNDTGPAHISSHLNKKGLVLFGSHVSSNKVSIGENNMKALEVKNLKNLKVETVINKMKIDLN